MSILPAIQAPAHPHVSDFTATEDEVRLADFLAYAAGGNDPEGYSPGWREPRPPVEPDAITAVWWQGFNLGDNGILASPIGILPEGHRTAFRDAHKAGWDRHVERLCDELAEAEAWSRRLSQEWERADSWPEAERRHMVGGKP